MHLSRDGYGETRELLERLAPRVHIAPWRLRRTLPAGSGARVLLVDSVGPDDSAHVDDPMPRDTALVAFDTTCFWRTSGRIARVVRWARRHDVPVALFRSHNKLDSFGIEYGRLGSIVVSWRRRSSAARMRGLVRETRDAIRLLGVAAIPAHLPPFAGQDAYELRERATDGRDHPQCAASLRPVAALAAGPGVVLYAHGLYLTIAPSAELRVQDVKRAATALCAALPTRGLPARHAGSFGFDFIAVEWFTDARTKKNVLRVAPGDGPDVDDRRAGRRHRRMVCGADARRIALKPRTESCWVDTAPPTRYGRSRARGHRRRRRRRGHRGPQRRVDARSAGRA